GRRSVPVATLAVPAPERPPERPPRQEPAHAAEEGLLAGDEARGEELRQDGIVQNGAQGTGRQDRLDLRREQQLPVAARVVERLDPEAVTRQQQPALPAVPQGDGDNPAQPLDTALSFLLVEVQDGLGVAAGPVAMPVRLQLGAAARGGG